MRGNKPANLAIDNWKLPFYEKELERGGFEFSRGAGFRYRGVTLVTLLVDTIDQEGLAAVVIAAQAAAKKSRLN